CASNSSRFSLEFLRTTASGTDSILMRKIGVTCLLTLLLASFATGQRGPARKAKAPPKLSDAQIEAAIRAKFAASKISTNHFQVHVQGGVATLEGRTEIVQHKGTATRLAKTAGA